MNSQTVFGICVLLSAAAVVIYGILKKLKVISCGCCSLETRTPRPEDERNNRELFELFQQQMNIMRDAALASQPVVPQSEESPPV